MKKRLISLLCAVAMIFSLLPMTVFAEEPIAVGLTVAPVLENGTRLEALHAGDRVVATVTLPANVYSSIQLKLAFDKTRFNFYYVDTTLLPAYVKGTTNPITGESTPSTSGWTNITTPSATDANANGYVAVGAIAYTTEDKPGNVTAENELVVFKAYF